MPIGDTHIRVSEYRDLSCVHLPWKSDEEFERYLDYVHADRSADKPKAIVWSRWEQGRCVLVSLLDFARPLDAGEAVAAAEAILRDHAR